MLHCLFRPEQQRHKGLPHPPSARDHIRQGNTLVQCGVHDYTAIMALCRPAGVKSLCIYNSYAAQAHMSWFFLWKGLISFPEKSQILAGKGGGEGESDRWSWKRNSLWHAPWGPLNRLNVNILFSIRTGPGCSNVQSEHNLFQHRRFCWLRGIYQSPLGMCSK